MTAGLRRDHLSGLLLAALGAYAAWESLKLPLGSFSDPGPGYFPLALAALLAAFGLLVGFFGGASASLGALRWREGRHAAAIVGAGAFAALAIEALGYRVTVAVMLVFLLGVVERKPLPAVAAVAAGLSLGSYWLFAGLLRVPLPVGAWGF